MFFRSIRIPRAGVVALFLLGEMSFLSTALYAQESPGRVNLAVAFRYSVLTGQEQPGANWSDLSDNGVGGSAEVGYMVHPAVAIHVGLAYDTFSGKNIALSGPGGGIVTGTFSDMNPYSFYGGAKVYVFKLINPGNPGSVDVYIRGEVGGVYFSSVHFSGSLGTVSLGGSRTNFSWAAGSGVEARISQQLSFFVEAKYQDYGRPGNAGNPFTAIPLSYGLRYSL